MATTAFMTCPKCRGQMSSYERNGITIELCGECRGIFLDRGELERLINAEAAFARASAPPYGQGQYGQGQYDQRPYEQRHRSHHDDDDDDDRYRGHDKHHRRRGGFLGELFD